MEEWIQNFEPQTKEELLALDAATALNDLPNLAFYLSYAKKYPEYLIRRTLAIVKDIPDAKIKKSRGALFNYLMQKHGREYSQTDSGH
jgi:hypothetical protein